MKKFYVLLAFVFSVSSIFSQTLFTYGGFAVGKEEFLKAYNKNKTTVTDKEKAYREYLDLYSRFKLKVRAARDLKLDTLAQLQYDLESFRGQVEDSYLNNESAVNALADEAFARIQTDRHVVHFFLPMGPSLSAADSARAYTAMNELYTRLGQGEQDHGKLAADLSAKYSKINYADLGFVTAFTVPYEYETLIYGLKSSAASRPYRTRNGLHIFKVTEERKSAGKWRIAQILFAIPPGTSPENLQQIKLRADSVYDQLKAGADFAGLAKKYSDDKLTYAFGGEMPEFGTGKFELAFEQEVFKLSKAGEFSKPFSTPFGFHIVKKLVQTPTPTDKNDPTFQYELKQKVLQDPRISTAKDNFTKEVIARIGYKRIPGVKDADLFRYADSVAAKAASANVGQYPISKRPIFSLAKTNITGADWLAFIRDYKGNVELYKGETNPALFNKFIATAAMDHYKKNLEEYNSEFHYQMEEFREGNMLFEIMERNVWGTAAADTIGLKQHYAANKNKYLWTASANVIVFNTNNNASADAVIAALKSGKEWKKVVESFNNSVQADSGRYELAQLSLAPGDPVAEGVISRPVVNTIDGSTSFVKIIAIHPPNQQRSFDEARGLVINDYQNILEERWINELKKKYPIKVNEAVFASLLK